jgi:hypothetical protein
LSPLLTSSGAPNTVAPNTGVSPHKNGYFLDNLVGDSRRNSF